MSLTIELPRPLDEELTQEAEREGVSTADHATLLLYLANALVTEDKPSVFKETVKVFLSYHHLDADYVAAVFEALVASCLHDMGKESDAFQQKLADAISNEDFAPLRQWRNNIVHQMQMPGRLNRSEEKPIASAEEKEAARIATIKAGRGSMVHIGVSVDDLHRERQEEKEKEEEQIRRYLP